MINDDSRTPDDDSIAQPFDQTNDQVDGLEGDSDGTAESDLRSAAERGDSSHVRRDRDHLVFHEFCRVLSR